MLSYFPRGRRPNCSVIFVAVTARVEHAQGVLSSLASTCRGAALQRAAATMHCVTQGCVVGFGSRCCVYAGSCRPYRCITAQHRGTARQYCTLQMLQ